MTDAILRALSMAFAMGWEILWPLILGFALSGVVQAVVSHQEMSRLLPDDRPRSVIPLWPCAIYLSDVAAAVLGLIWMGGRVLYFVNYSKAAEKRLSGFFIQSTACLLFVGAVAGLIQNLKMKVFRALAFAE
jgi:hypothetical protein